MREPLYGTTWLEKSLSRLHPAFHLFGRNVFHMRGQIPTVTERVENASGAVAIELRGDGAFRGSA